MDRNPLSMLPMDLRRVGNRVGNTHIVLNKNNNKIEDIEMAQQIKVLVTKTDDLSSFSRTYMVGAE